MELIIHPEVNNLKEQLTRLIFEYDNLSTHICPEIERLYVLEFGIFEYKLYELELKIDKLKRKIQLIQIDVNHENEIDLAKIEEMLCVEFKEYEKQLKTQINEIKFLEENKPDKLSQNDSKKLKKIYRGLIKKLHPDLNPNQSLFELNLFYRSVSCFENGDLKGLESVTAILPEETGEEICQIDKLKEIIKDYEDKISKLKNDYPYNKKELLENRDSGQEYKDMLLKLIDDRKKHIEKLEDKISELIKNV